VQGSLLVATSSSSSSSSSTTSSSRLASRPADYYSTVVVVDLSSASLPGTVQLRPLKLTLPSNTNKTCYSGQILSAGQNLGRFFLTNYIIIIHHVHNIWTYDEPLFPITTSVKIEVRRHQESCKSWMLRVFSGKIQVPDRFFQIGSLSSPYPSTQISACSREACASKLLV